MDLLEGHQAKKNSLTFRFFNFFPLDVKSSGHLTLVIHILFIDKIRTISHYVFCSNFSEEPS
jgi:hypothetical protein